MKGLFTFQSLSHLWMVGGNYIPHLSGNVFLHQIGFLNSQRYLLKASYCTILTAYISTKLLSCHFWLVFSNCVLKVGFIDSFLTQHKPNSLPEMQTEGFRKARHGGPNTEFINMLSHWISIWKGLILPFSIKLPTHLSLT